MSGHRVTHTTMSGHRVTHTTMSGHRVTHYYDALYVVTTVLLTLKSPGHRLLVYKVIPTILQCSP